MESNRTSRPKSHYVGLTNTAVPKGLRYSELSAPRQALVRLCQSINYGSIDGLQVQDAEPILSPPPSILVDVKLDGEEVPREEIYLRDFEVCLEVRRLISQLENFKEVIIERIEIRAGIPRRIIFRGSPTMHRPLPQNAPPPEPVDECRDVQGDFEQ